MNLPPWIPLVRRPWNPAYSEAWDSMSPNEKRASWLFDALVVAIVVAIVLGACWWFGSSPARGASLPPVDRVGARITVESYSCVVKTERTIECRNVGRVCRAKVAAYEAWSKTWFGCAAKNAHCPTEAESAAHPNPSECWPLWVGSP